MVCDSQTGELWGIFMNNNVALGRINATNGLISYDIPFNPDLSVSSGASAYDR